MELILYFVGGWIIGSVLVLGTYITVRWVIRGRDEQANTR